MSIIHLLTTTSAVLRVDPSEHAILGFGSSGNSLQYLGPFGAKLVTGLCTYDTDYCDFPGMGATYQSIHDQQSPWL